MEPIASSKSYRHIKATRSTAGTDTSRRGKAPVGKWGQTPLATITAPETICHVSTGGLTPFSLYNRFMDGQTRSNIRPGMRVRVVEKQNQRTGQLTEGVVQRILTKSPHHPHGIKVMLENGIVGRVKEIIK